MHRGLTGHYVPSIAGGISCQAFVPQPLPPSPALHIDSKLQKRINEANRALGRLDAISMLLPDTNFFLYSYVRKEAVMSSQIEGTQSSLNDLMLYEMEGVPGVPMNDVQEVSCYVKALHLGVQRINDGYPITYRLITEMHRALMISGRGINRGPGEFRDNQVWIGGHRADEAAFVPPPRHVLSDCWSDLEKFINDHPEATDPLIKAALAHAQFETIHPFMDGNGRLGRLLIPLILVEAKVLQHPLLYLSVFFKKYQTIYYERLQQTRMTGDWEAWLLFFVDAVAATATQAVEMAKELNQLHTDNKAQLATLGRLSRSASQVLDAMFEHPIANINNLIAQTGLTATTTGKVLMALENKLKLVLEITGHKRHRIYAYRGYLEVLNKE